MVVGVEEFSIGAEGSHVAHAFVLCHGRGERVRGVRIGGLEDVASWIPAVVGGERQSAEPCDIGERHL